MARCRLHTAGTYNIRWRRPRHRRPVRPLEQYPSRPRRREWQAPLLTPKYLSSPAFKQHALPPPPNQHPTIPPHPHHFPLLQSVLRFGHTPSSPLHFPAPQDAAEVPPKRPLRSALPLLSCPSTSTTPRRLPFHSHQHARSYIPTPSPRCRTSEPDAKRLVGCLIFATQLSP